MTAELRGLCQQLIDTAAASPATDARVAADPLDEFRVAWRAFLARLTLLAPAVTDELGRLLGDHDPRVRLAAAKTLAELTHNAGGALVLEQRLDDLERRTGRRV